MASFLDCISLRSASDQFPGRGAVGTWSMVGGSRAASRRQDEALRAAAGVVLFHPRAKACERLVAELCASFAQVFLVLNSQLEWELQEALGRHPGLILLGDGTNQGIGAALNMIATAATRDGFSRVMVFDQDSSPDAETVAKVYGAGRELRNAGLLPAVVGPRLVARSGSPAGKAPAYRRQPCKATASEHTPVAFLPTSGSLIDLDLFAEIGPFRADYFMDGIDLEWCFRAWSQGHGCWLAEGATMEHEVGSGVISWPFPPFRMPKQRPFRMYCYVRNSVFGFRLGHVPFGWKLRQAAYVPLQILAYTHHYGWSRRILALLASAVVNGVRGRLGSPASQAGCDLDVSGSATGCRQGED